LLRRGWRRLKREGTTTRPLSEEMGTGPKWRLSKELLVASPVRKTRPGGTTSLTRRPMAGETRIALRKRTSSSGEEIR
jgi:hypothetical protein